MLGTGGPARRQLCRSSRSWTEARGSGLGGAAGLGVSSLEGAVDPGAQCSWAQARAGLVHRVDTQHP